MPPAPRLPEYQEINLQRAAPQTIYEIDFVGGPIFTQTADAFNVSVNLDDKLAVIAIADRNADIALAVEQSAEEIDALIASLQSILPYLRASAPLREPENPDDWPDAPLPDSQLDNGGACS